MSPKKRIPDRRGWYDVRDKKPPRNTRVIVRRVLAVGDEMQRMWWYDVDIWRPEAKCWLEFGPGDAIDNEYRITHWKRVGGGPVG